jgi:hypothetical protein
VHNTAPTHRTPDDELWMFLNIITNLWDMGAGAFEEKTTETAA